MAAEVLDRSKSVFVVDDSSTVRRLVSLAIDRQPGLRVVGQAANGKSALRMLKNLRPDAVVLDVHMPVMDGLEALPHIEKALPGTHVVLFSHTTPDTCASLDAAILSGSADFVPKPTGLNGAQSALQHLNQTLIPRLRQGRDGQPAKPDGRRGRRRLTPAAAQRTDVIVIGASTGGPVALEQVFRDLPERVTVPILVVQHISADFSGSLAEQLDRVSHYEAREAVEGGLLEPGVIHIAPGDRHLVVAEEEHRVVTRLDGRPPVNSCRPSVDVLFQSTAAVFGPRQLGVVLTGMGSDGRDGCAALSSRGAGVMVQDEATSTIWGMPGAVLRAGYADEVQPLDAIAERIDRWVTTTHTKRRPAADV